MTMATGIEAVRKNDNVIIRLYFDCYGLQVSMTSDEARQWANAVIGIADQIDSNSACCRYCGKTMPDGEVVDFCPDCIPF